MPLFSTGLNHTTADTRIREQLAFPETEIGSAVTELRRCPFVREAVIVSTCNRTELYCMSEAASAEPLVEWLGRYHGIQPERMRRYLYTYEGRLAVRHLLRVASGLDSMVLGEPQILGQVKEAYRQARASSGAGTILSRLFEHAFSAAKRIRTETLIGAHPVSIASAAVGLARQIFANFPEHTALLVGAGETMALVARHLRENGLGRLIIANRTLERAQVLAHEFGGYAIPLEEISSHLAEADIVVCSTASPATVVSGEMVRAAVRRRKRRPMFIVDLALPRDVDEDVARLEDVYLYNLDDLGNVIEENQASRGEAARLAEEIVDQETDDFLAWLRSRDAAGTIRELRSRAEEIRGETLERARRMLANGRDADGVLEYLAHTLTNRLLHSPTARLRQAGRGSDQDLLRAARSLFELDEPGE